MRSGALAGSARLPAIVLALTIAIVPRIARAQGDAVSGASEPGLLAFSWARGEGAEGCPDERAIAARIAHRLGSDPFVAQDEPAPRSLEGWVTREDGALVATLVLRSGDGVVGSRALRSTDEDCITLAASVVLAAALAIDPEASLRPDLPSRSEAPLPEAPEPEPAPDPVADAPPLPAAPDDDRVAALVAIEGGLLLGPLPHVAPTLGLRGALRFDHTLAIEARAAWSPAVTTGDATFGAGLIGLGAAIAVAEGERGRVEIAIGAVLGITDAHAEPDETRVALASGPFVWGGPTLGARAELALGRVARAGLAVDALVALPDRLYAVAGTERVLHEALPIALSAAFYVGAEAP